MRTHRATSVFVVAAVLLLSGAVGATAEPVTVTPTTTAGQQAAEPRAEEPPPTTTPEEQPSTEPAPEPPPAADPPTTEPTSTDSVPTEPAPTAEPAPTTEPPATAEPAPRPAVLPDVGITAAYDKPSYDLDETIHVTVTITNTGAAPADGVRVQVTDIDNVGNPFNHTDFWQFGTGAHLEPGETRVLHGDSTSHRGRDQTRLGGTAVLTGEDADPADNSFHVNATVVPVYADYDGIVYFDRNGNGLPDPGEGLGGVGVTLIDRDENSYSDRRSTTTDADGRFGFAHMYTAGYAVEVGRGPDGHVVGFPDSGYLPRHDFVLGREGRTELIEATRPLTDSLSASLSFDKPSYAMNDPVTFTVVLRNTGQSTLTGVRITQSAEDGEYPPDARWSPIGAADPGIVLVPGETRTLTLPMRIQGAGGATGYTRASFVLTADGFAIAGLASMGDVRWVALQYGSATGQLVHYSFPPFGPDPDQRPAAGRKVILVHSDGEPFGAAYSDANGFVRFDNVRIGDYRVHIVGHSYATYGSPFAFPIVHVVPNGRAVVHTLIPFIEGEGDNADLMPGQPPVPGPDPVTPPGGVVALPVVSPGTTGKSVSAASAVSGLAETGADVRGLTAAAAAAFLCGVALLVFGRRKITR
jgi:hypothetical protein